MTTRAVTAGMSWLEMDHGLFQAVANKGVVPGSTGRWSKF